MFIRPNTLKKKHVKNSLLHRQLLPLYTTTTRGTDTPVVQVMIGPGIKDTTRPASASSTSFQVHKIVISAGTYSS